MGLTYQSALFQQSWVMNILTFPASWWLQEHVFFVLIKCRLLTTQFVMTYEQGKYLRTQDVRLKCRNQSYTEQVDFISVTNRKRRVYKQRWRRGKDDAFRLYLHRFTRVPWLRLKWSSLELVKRSEWMICSDNSKKAPLRELKNISGIFSTLS